MKKSHGRRIRGADRASAYLPRMQICLDIIIELTIVVLNSCGKRKDCRRGEAYHVAEIPEKMDCRGAYRAAEEGTSV